MPQTQPSHVMEQSEINSRQWWEQYFAAQWDANKGGEKTRHFMERLIGSLPAAEAAFLRQNDLKILDWGCAFGEGVKLLAQTFPNSRITGVDFAARAIEEARKRHPHQQFERTEDGAIPAKFDVIITSNCLEHFENPIEIITRHLASYPQLYIALVPYNEAPMIESHRAQFREESFPERIGEYVRFHISPIEVEPWAWRGKQLLVCYASPAYLKSRLSTDDALERDKWDAYYASLPLFEPDESTQRFNVEFVDRISQLLAPGNSVLEAGCGAGWQSLALARTGQFQTQLLDFSQNALAYSRRLFERENVSAEFVSGDVFTRGQAEFDLVFNAGVLEHYAFDEQVNFLRGMASRSRNYVLVLVPNRYCYWYWLWRIRKTGQGEWPFGNEIPLGDMADVFEAAGIQYLGQAFMGESWTEAFIEQLTETDAQMRNDLLAIHRSPVIAAAHKGYLVAVLGTVENKPATVPPGWSRSLVAENRSETQTCAAIADALALRIGAEQKLTRSDTRLAEKEKRVEELVQALAAKDQVIQNEISDKLNESKRLHQTIAERDANILELNSQIAQRNFDAQWAAGQIKEKDSAIEQMKAELGHRVAEAQERLSQYERLQQEVAARDATIVELNALHAQRTLDANWAASQIKEKDSTMEKMKAELEHRASEAQERQREHERLTREITTRDATVLELKGHLARRDLDAQRAAGQIDEKDASIERIQTRLDQRDAELAKTNAQRELCEAKLAEANEHLARAAITSAELRERDSRIGQLEAELRNCVQTAQRAVEQAAASEQALQRLRAELETRTAQYQSAERKATEHELTILRLWNDFERGADESQRAAQEISELRAEIVRRQVKLESAAAHSQEIAQQLMQRENALHAIESRLSKVEGTLEAELQSRKAEMPPAAEAVSERNNDLASALAAQDATICRLQSELADHAASAAHRDAEIAQRNAEIAQRDAALEDLRDELETATSRREALRGALATEQRSRHLLEAQIRKGYRHLVRRIGEIAQTELPEGANVLVVSKGDNELLTMEGRHASHFPQSETGVYAGRHPADSAEAIRQLEHLRGDGADYLLFPNTTFWWLDHYTDLRKHLDAHYTRTWSDEGCIIYKLGKKESLNGNGKHSPGDKQEPAATAIAAPVETAQPAETRAAFDVVCFPIIDWDFRFQRPQQLMLRFAAAGHRVYYIAQNFRDSGAPYELTQKAENVFEVSLRGPRRNVYRDALDDEARDQLFESLDALRRDQSFGATLSVIQLPFWQPLVRKARAEFAWRAVYDCMDHHAGFSTNQPQMIEQENDLFASSDLVIVSSIFLEKEARAHSGNVLLVRNGCDYEHFAATPASKRHKRPVIGYYGAIADWFDSDLVADLAEKRPDWDFVLVGSTYTADLTRLSKLPNVTLPGEKPYAEIPQWLGRFDVALLPFKRVPLTEATNPVKAYEILAAGKPLVSVPLPEMIPMSAVVRFGSTASEFEREIAAALTEKDPALLEERRRFARENTWQKRFDVLLPATRSVFPKASVVIVTYNNLKLNQACLESLYARTEWPNFEVIVIDNASTDATPEFLQHAERNYPRLIVDLKKENYGFSGGNNIGLAQASGEFIVLLNNDTVLTRGWLTALIKHLSRDPNLGLVGPVTNEIGNESKVAVDYLNLAEMPGWAANYVREHDGQLFPIPMLAMFCVAMRREVFEKIGPLDPQFETGMFEDDDYTRRMRHEGYEIRCARDSFVHHVGSASFKLLTEKKYLDVFVKNRRLYQQKWGDMWQPHLDEKDRRRIPGMVQQMQEIVEASGVPADRVLVMLPSIGWMTPLVQRPHHLARELARQGFLVFFDCSGSVLDIFAGFITPEKNLWLYNGPSGVLDHLERPILWTLPYNAPLVDRWPKRTVVYDWIDDLSVFAYNQNKLRENHNRMLAEADIVLCVARELIAQAGTAGRKIVYSPNGVDYRLFSSPADASVLDPKFSQLIANGHPVVGYYGAIASWFDVELVAKVSRLRKDWNFVLIGHKLSDVSLAELEDRPNVLILDAQKYEHLPAYLAHFTVATIPFRINEITKATSPLKLYEYFAGGRPVISTPMPECMAYPEVHIVRNAREFAKTLDVARNEIHNPQKCGRLRTLGQENSWTKRVDVAMKKLDSNLSKKGAVRKKKAVHIAAKR